MKPLISIIIPAYNVGEYVIRCIESINSQTFNNYEVIIVDDGSTDNTLEIIKQNITDKYKVISQKNMGAGMARNVGVELASGEYITFMDADDFLYNNVCLEKLANIIKKEKCDVVTYKMVRYYQKNNKYFFEDNITSENKKYEDIYDYLDMTIKNSRLSVSPCDKIIKTNIIKKNKIYFENLLMLEDIDWSLNLYKYINNIFVYNEPIYVYRKGRNNSTTSFYNRKKSSACYDFIFKWCDWCKQQKHKFSNLYLHYIAYQYTILVAAVNKKNCDKIILKKLRDFSWLLKYDFNFKTKKARKIYNMFGYDIMIFVLKGYMFLKQKNLILIRK